MPRRSPSFEVLGVPIPNDKRLLIGGAVGLGAALLALASWRRSRAARVPPAAKGDIPTTAEVEGMDEAAVMQLLRCHLTLSPETLKALDYNNINGSILLTLVEEQLMHMGVQRFGDRIKICRFIETILSSEAKSRIATNSEAIDRDTADAEGCVASPTETHPLEPLAKPTGAAPGPEVEVVKELESLYRIFSDESFLTLPLEKQQLLLKDAEARYGRVVDALAALPPHVRAPLIGFTQSFGEMLKKVIQTLSVLPPGVTMAGALAGVQRQGAATSTQQPEKSNPMTQAVSQETLKAIVPMLKEMYQVLDSPAFDLAPQERRKEICAELLTQARKVAGIAPQLYPAHREQLVTVCERLISAINAKSVPPAVNHDPEPPQRVAAPTADAAATKEKAVSASVLLGRLRGLFTTLQDEKFLESFASKTPDEMLRTIMDMGEQLSSVKKDAALLPDPKEKVMVDQVVENIALILEQLSKLANSPELGSGATQAAKAEPIPTASSHTVAGYQIAESLKAVMDALTSPSFLADPLSKSAVLLETLRDCQEKAEKLDPVEREKLNGLCLKLKELLQMNIMARRGTKTAPTGQVSPSKETTSTAAATGTDGPVPPDVFWAVKARCESVYKVISSKAFQELDPATQTARAKELAAVLRDQRAIMDRELPNPADRKGLEELWQSLDKIVSRLITIGEDFLRSVADVQAQAKAKDKDPSRVEELDDPEPLGEGEKAGKGEQMRLDVNAAIERLQQIYSAVETEEFESLPPEEQRELRVKLYTALEQLRQDVEDACVGPDTAESELMQSKVLPLVLQLQDVLGRGIVSEEEDGLDEKGTEDVSDPRRMLFDTASRTLRLLKTGAMRSKEDIGDCERLLTLLEEFDDLTEEETKKRDELKAAMEEAKEKPETSDVITFERLINTFNAIDDELAKLEPNLTSRSQLIPFMSTIETILHGCEEAGLDWQHHTETAKAVQKILERLETLRGNLGESRPVSELETSLAEARRGLVESLASGEINDRQQLSPYLAMLKSLESVSTDMTLEQRREMALLQQAILDAYKTLHGEGGNVEDEEYENENGGENEINDDKQADDENDQKRKNGKGGACESLEDDTAPMSRLPHSDSRDGAAAVNPPSVREIIPGSLDQEISLLSRILEHLNGNHDKNDNYDFISETSLFELRSIVHLLNRLSDQLTDPAGKLLVQRVWDEVGTQLYHASGGEGEPTKDDINLSMHDVLHNSQLAETKAKDPRAAIAEVGLRLTGMRSENEASGEEIIHYTVFSPEDEGYTTDKAFIAPLLSNKNDLAIEAPAQGSVGNDGTTRTATGRNLSIIISVPKSRETSEVSQSGGTALAELSHLSEILDRDYGFDNAVFANTDLSGPAVLAAVRTAVERSLGAGAGDGGAKAQGGLLRILLFFHTGKPMSLSPRNYAVTFADGSTLSHRELLATAIEKAVSAGAKPAALLIHDAETSLQVLSAVYQPGAKGEGDNHGEEAANHDEKKGRRRGRKGKSAETKEPSNKVTADKNGYCWSPHLATSVTESAITVANTSRCWLYDGLFTPLVCELLTTAATTNAKTRARYPDVIWLCPEDVVNYATLVLVGTEAENRRFTMAQEQGEDLPRTPAGEQLPEVGCPVLPDGGPLRMTFFARTRLEVPQTRKRDV